MASKKYALGKIQCMVQIETMKTEESLEVKYFYMQFPLLNISCLA